MGEGDEGGFGFGSDSIGIGSDTSGFSSDGWGTGSLGAPSEGIGSAGAPGGFGGDSFGLSDSFGFSDSFGLGDVDFSSMPNFLGTDLGNISNDIGFSPSFVDSNMSLADSFNSNLQDEDGFGKFAKGLFGFISNPVVSTIGKMADKTGMFGPAVGIGNLAAKGAKGDNAGVGKGLGSMFGGMVGSIGGPLGSMAGAALGGFAGQSLGGVTANQGISGMQGVQGHNDGTGGGMFDTVAGTLAAQYMGNRAKGQYNQALGSLNDIYSPNGVYAQQLRQQMERRDAAAGRRSQYGPREAQLMAALADSQARTMSSPGYANLMQQRGIAQNQGLNTLFALMSKNPQVGRSIGNGIESLMSGGGLGSLFNGGYSNEWDLPANAGPQMDQYIPDDLFGSPGSLSDPGMYNDMPNYFEIGF